MIEIGINTVVGWGIIWILAQKIQSIANPNEAIKFLSGAGQFAPAVTLWVRSEFFGHELGKRLPWWAVGTVVAGSIAAGFLWPLIYSDFKIKG